MVAFEAAKLEGREWVSQGLSTVWSFKLWQREKEREMEGGRERDRKRKVCVCFMKETLSLLANFQRTTKDQELVLGFWM